MRRHHSNNLPLVRANRLRLVEVNLIVRRVCRDNARLAQRDTRQAHSLVRHAAVQHLDSCAAVWVGEGGDIESASVRAGKHGGDAVGPGGREEARAKVLVGVETLGHLDFGCAIDDEEGFIVGGA